MRCERCKAYRKRLHVCAHCERKLCGGCSFRSRGGRVCAGGGPCHQAALRAPRAITRTVTYGESTYKVRGRVEVPDLNTMDRLAALIWLNRHTYARGYSKSNPLAGIGAAITVKS